LVAGRWLVRPARELEAQHRRHRRRHGRRRRRYLEDQRREGGALRDASGGPILPQQILVEAVDRVRQRTGREEGQGHNAGGGGSELINDSDGRKKSVQCIYGTQGIERRAVAAVANSGWNYNLSIDYCDDKPRLAVASATRLWHS
ncbi:hypothetical protein CI238_01363, partial [Colletotrichum incanum]